MNRYTNKRSFLEVYSSEEEEIIDVNRLQEEFESEGILSDSLSDSLSDAESTDSNNDVALRLEIGRVSCLFIIDNI